MGAYQVLEDDGERLIRVDDVMQRHDVGMLQIPQQRHCTNSN